MRLECKVIVQPSSSNVVHKSANATVAVEKKVLFVKFQAKNKTQSKFDLNKENVSKIHEKFIGNGKLTIQFRQPRADVMISEFQCAVSSLRSFVDRFHKILDGKDDGPNRKLSNSATVSKPAKVQLVVTQTADYPHEGFPSTLQDLRITGLARKSVDGRWFALKPLTRLDLSNNKLGEATDFAKFAYVSRLVNLQSLILAKNQLRHLPLYFWRRLPKSLIHLDVSGNELERIPPDLGRLENLVELMLNDNRLVELPLQLGFLSHLRTLNISHNRLSYLPATILWLSKDMKKLDATANHPDLYSRSRCVLPVAAEGGVASLQELAAVVVQERRLDTLILPEIFRCYLMSDSVSRCAWCRRLRAPSSMLTVQSVFDLSRKCSTVESHNQQGKFVQIRGLLCSRSCRDFV